MYEQQRKKGRPLTGTERSLIEHLYKLGFTQTAIAKEVGVWPSTICRELKGVGTDTGALRSCAGCIDDAIDLLVDTLEA